MPPTLAAVPVSIWVLLAALIGYGGKALVSDIRRIFGLDPDDGAPLVGLPLGLALVALALIVLEFRRR